MSDFKTVGGTNRRDNRILNLDKVCEITLDEEYLENSNCVRIYTERGENWNFETDLEHIGDVFDCLKNHLNGVIVFSKRFKDRTKREL